MRKPSWNTTAEREFWRRKCLDSFWWYFRYAWGYDFNPKGAAGKRPWLDESTHKEACDWYEMHVKEWLSWRAQGLNKQKKLLVVVPRDWGKTTLFTQAGQSWLHLHDPEIASYTGCDTTKRAREVLSGIKAVISGDDQYSRFAWLYGSQKNQKRRWYLDAILTAARTNLTRKDASYGTWGVLSGLVGMHPDACFFDDPNTYEQMHRHADWLDIVCQHLDLLIPVFQSDALWMLTGTRYGDGDHIGRSVKHEGVASITGMPMPGIKVEEDGAWHVFFMDALDGDKPTMPKIWSPDRIRDFERRNPQKFYAQVRNNPTQSPHNILTMAAAERMIVDPKTVDLKKLRVSIHCDCAFKSPRRKARGDFNVIAACGHMTDGTGRVVYLGAKIDRSWDSNGFSTALVDSVAEWRGKCARVACITDEPDIGGKPGLWPAHIHNIFKGRGVPQPTYLELNRGGKQKPERLGEAASMWRDGRMLLMRDAPGLDELLDEMTKIGMSEHDDVADATADAFNKQVYTAVWAKGTAPTVEGTNPFDDVLKPGPVGDAAAEKIAAMYELQDQMNMQRFDVVEP